MRGRKGFIASSLVDFYAYVVFVFIIIIFAIMFNFMGAGITEKIGGKTYVKTDLLNFIRIPVESDINNDGIAENLTIGELVVLGELNDETVKIIKEKTDKIKDIIWEKGKPGMCKILFVIVKGDDKKTINYGIPGKSVRIGGEIIPCHNSVTHEILLPVPEGYESETKISMEIWKI